MLPKFKKNFDRKKQPNGKPNPKYVDSLEEDRPIRDQNFACVSFISPEKIVKQKELFMFEQFVRQWDFNKSMEKFVIFLNFLSEKFSIKFEDLTDDFKSFVDTEKENLSTTITGDYKTYIEKNEDDLEKKFMSDHAFQTSTRGIKIRGVYPSQEEAELRCKFLREKDPHFDIFVGPVGVWMPFDPDAYKTGKVEFLEEELNQLVNEKLKNESKAKEMFDERIKETKQKAIEDNRKMAEKTGNRLTQTITESGVLTGIEKIVDNLTEKVDSVSVVDGPTKERELKTMEYELRKAGIEGATDELSIAQIKERLFDDIDVVVGNGGDHGQSRLISGPFAPSTIGANSNV